MLMTICQKSSLNAATFFQPEDVDIAYNVNGIHEEHLLLENYKSEIVYSQEGCR